MTKKDNAQQRKAAMVRFINENGGKASMNMKTEQVQEMYYALQEKLGKNAKQADEQAEKMISMTESEFKKYLEEVKKPLKDEIERLRAAGQQKADSKREEFINAYMAYKQAHEKYMAVLREGKLDETLKQAADAARMKVQSMEMDASFREYIADLLADSSKITREYGHRGVNAVAKGMHATVDGIANVMDATSELVRGTTKFSFSNMFKKKDKPAQA